MNKILLILLRHFVVISFFAFLIISKTLAQSINYALPVNLSSERVVLEEISFDISDQSTIPEGLSFSNDGTKLFIADNDGNEVDQYSLTVPFDITTGASFDGSFPIFLQQNGATGITFNPTGDRMFILGVVGSEINQYNLAVPFDITSGVSFAGNPFIIGNQETEPTGLAFNNEGTKLFVVGSRGDAVLQYSLSNPFDITNGVTFDGNPFNLGTEVIVPRDLAFNSNGTQLFILDSGSDNVFQYTLTIPFDITSGVSLVEQQRSIIAAETWATGITFDPTGNRMYLVGRDVLSISQYLLNDSNAFRESTTEVGMIEGEMIISLSDALFNTDVSNEITIENLPDGLVPTFTLGASNNFGILTLSGNAINNGQQNDISSLRFTFGDAAFSNLSAVEIMNSVSSESGLGIDFDPGPFFLTSQNVRFAEARSGLVIDLDAIDLSIGVIDENISYQITGGTDQAFFSVIPESGLLSISSPFDFENPSDAGNDNLYEIQITATNGSFTSSLDLSISVQDVEESINYSLPFEIGSSEIGLDADPFEFTGFNADPQSIVFNHDGSKMFVLGGFVRRVIQYSLSVPFDISSTLIEDGIFNLFSMAGQVQGLVFNNNGTKMFVLDSGSDNIFQFSLASPFDITAGVTFDGNPFSVAGQELIAQDLAFDPTGTRLYVVGSGGDAINQYSLSTPFDIRDNVTFDGNPFSVAEQETVPTAIAFDGTGSKLFLLGAEGDLIYEYELSIPYEITEGMTFSGNTFSVAIDERVPQDLVFDPVNTRMFVVGTDSDEVNSYRLNNNTGFAETLENEGELTGEMLVSVVGTRFSNAGETLTDISVENLPVGLLPVLAVNDVGNFGTLSFTGQAAVHSDTEDVGSLRFTFADEAFENSIAFDVANSQDAESNVGVDFDTNPEFLFQREIFLLEGTIGVVSDLNAVDGLGGMIDENISYQIIGGADQSFFTINEFTGELSVPQPLNADLIGDADSNNMYEVMVQASNGLGNINLSLQISLLNDEENLVYSAPFDLINEPVTFDGNSLSVPDVSSPHDILFNPEGTRMYVLSNRVFGSADIFQYELTTPFEITNGVTLNPNSPFRLPGGGSFTPNGLAFNSEGTRLFIVGVGNNRVVQYELNTPFDFTGGFVSNQVIFDISSQITRAEDITFNNQGTKMFIVGRDDTGVFEYDLEIPFDLSSNVVFNGNFFSLGDLVFVPTDVAFNRNGTKMFITLLREVRQYDLIAPFEISEGVTFVGSFSVQDQGVTPEGLTFSTDNRLMYTIGGFSGQVNEYTLSDSNIFTEDFANEGAVDGELNITLNGDLFNNRGGSLADFSIDNLPLGLVPELQVSEDGSFATLTLNGAATAREDIDDVMNLQFSFDNEAFASSNAQEVENATNASSGFGIDFIDNNPPVFITGGVVSVAENVLGNVLDIDADNGEEGLMDEGVTYVISNSNDGDFFEIEETTGVLTFREIPNFENPSDLNADNVYLLEVVASDGVNTTSQPLEVTVTDVNEQPTIEIQSFNLDENSSQGLVFGTVTASDEEGTSLAYSIIGGNENNAFAINEITGELEVNDTGGIDFEIQSSFVLTIEVSDGLLTNNNLVNVSINDVPEAPVLNDSVINIPENTITETEIGTLMALDPEGDILTYVILSGNESGAFILDPITGIIAVNNLEALDFETNQRFNLVVMVSDIELSDQAAITINLTDVNEAPIITDQGFSITENLQEGTTVGTITASDQDDGDLLSFAIVSGNENGVFTLNESTGELRVGDAELLDFESAAMITFLVEASDGILIGSSSITVSLIDEPEAPVISNQSFSIFENTTAGSIAGIVTAEDPEGDVVTFEIVSGDLSNSFLIDAQTGELTVNEESLLNFELNPSINLTVNVSDGILNSMGTVDIQLIDLNDAPIVEEGEFNIPEGSMEGTLLGSVIASDEDDDSLIYSINSGNISSTFFIDPANGALTLNAGAEIDFETIPIFNLIVTVSDGRSTSTGSLIINVTDVDELPIVTNRDFIIAENTEISTSLGFINAFDPDGNSISYQIVSGNELGSFDINEMTGQLTVSSLIDFETTSAFNLTVEVSDGNLSVEQVFPVQVIDIDEIPIVEDQIIPILENEINGTAVGMVGGNDPEGNSLNYQIADGNISNAFSLNESTGMLFVNNSEVLDFEVITSFNLMVQVSDGVLITEVSIRIDLLDVAESPNIEDQVFEIEENLSNGSLVGNVIASDPDGSLLTYEFLSGNELNAFSLDNEGRIIVNDESILDFESNSVFELVVQVADNEFTVQANMDVNLSDIQETPSIVVQSFDVPENAEEGSLVGTVIGVDPEESALTYSIDSGNELNTFAINGDNGEVSVLDPSMLDFESRSSFTLTVMVSDGELIGSGNIIINLLDINEAPVGGNQIILLDENSENGTFVGEIIATDPEGDALSFTFSEGNLLDAFLIDQNTGSITVRNMEALDFEQNPIFNLTVQISDGDLNNTILLTINLNDIEEIVTSSGEEIGIEITVYPVPVANELTVHLVNDRVEDLSSISIVDLSGREWLVERKMIKPNEITLDISQLPAGYFILRIVKDGKRLNRSILKVNK